MDRSWELDGPTTMGQRLTWQKWPQPTADELIMMTDVYERPAYEFLEKIRELNLIVPDPLRTSTVHSHGLMLKKCSNPIPSCDLISN